MGRFLHNDRWLGLFFVLLAGVIAFVWVPLDTSSGLVETVRRKWVIGDALAPTVAACFLLLGGILTVAAPSSDQDHLTKGNLFWIATLLGLFTLSTVLMRYAGPLVAAMLTETGYRPLRATIPWKYIGYLLGGTMLVGGLTSFVRRRVLWSDWAIAFAAALIVALAYDLPFDDLLLPPNADV